MDWSVLGVIAALVVAPVCIVLSGLALWAYLYWWPQLVERMTP